MKSPLNLRLLSRVLSQPWAIREASLVELTQLILGGGDRADRQRADTSFNVPQWDGDGVVWAKLATTPGYTVFNIEGLYADRRGSLPPLPEGVSVLLVWGVLGRGWTVDDRWFLDPIEVDEILVALNAAPENSTVVLWFRSPGGIITGIPEAAAEMRRVAKARGLRLIAFSDDLAASAAYWLAAMCETIIATPTAEVGSIGVYLAFYDFVEYLNKAGVKLELFKVGELKGIWVMGNPLDDPARQYLMAGVEDSRRMFVRDVTNVRALDEATMQGQTFRGRAAQAANLLDGFQPSSVAFFAALAKGRV